MKHFFYVDVPSSYDYVWYDDVRCDASTALSRQLDVPMSFICNSIAKISKGDVYRVAVDDARSELFFLIKTGFDKLDNKIVEDYVKNKLV